MSDMEVRAIVTADPRRFISGFTKAEAKVTGFGNRVRGVMQRAGQGMARFGKKIGGFSSLLGGLGIVAAGKSVVEFDARLARLAIQAGIDKKRMYELKDELYAVGKATHQDPGALLSGLEQIVEKTGDFKAAEKALKDMGISASATGAHMADMGATTANLLEKAKIAAKDTLPALDILTAQGKEGAFTLQNIAANSERLFAAAGRVGIKGLGGVSIFGAWLQEARKGTGSAEQATTAIEGAVAEMIDKRREIYKLTGFDVMDVAASKKAGQEVYKPIDDMLKGIIAGAQGSESKLGKIFGRESIRAVTRMAQVFRDTGGFGEFDRFVNMGGDGTTIMKDFAFWSDMAAAKLKDAGTEGQKLMHKVMESPVDALGRNLGFINDAMDVGPIEAYKKVRAETEAAWGARMQDYMREKDTQITNNIGIHVYKDDRVITTTDNLNTKTNVTLDTGRF